MAKRKASKKLAQRRAHSSIEKLPEKLQAVLELMVIGKWPSDYEGVREGTPTYDNITRYCRDRGFVVSRSAIGRFGLKIDTQTARKTASSMRPYVLHALADAAQGFASLQYDFEAAAVVPERMEHSVTAENKPELETLSERYISRIERILTDLKRLK